MFTPPPQYQEPPANLRPIYYEGKDLKQSMSVHDYYPPQSAAPDPSNWSPSRAKLPFWRKKKGIALIVLLSNIIILAIVLGVVFATRGHHSATHSTGSSAGDNSEGSLSSTNQDGIPPVSNSPSSSASAPSFSSSSPPSSASPSASATMASMLPLFSAVAPSPAGGTTGADDSKTKPNAGGGNSDRVADLADQAKSP
ncbi:hypothetical protein NP233_g2534 [Leucocoprinus birnbaumii]|uniref:Uncharacterized protein n=1 Tax=Leucocoprinus birnbaumii TaxID=56174 RepID=A0AAD5YX78_9AGAR|nr:hypothetical protein NP233_g2534 [Leucocoprinus birnbaumii]